MKKKIIVALITSMVALNLIGCNKQILDLQYNYNYAIIYLQNGEVVEGKVQSWTDYDDGEQLQVKIDGVVYLTNSYNCTLMEK